MGKTVQPSEVVLASYGHKCPHCGGSKTPGRCNCKVCSVPRKAEATSRGVISALKAGVCHTCDGIPEWPVLMVGRPSDAAAPRPSDDPQYVPDYLARERALENRALRPRM